MVVSALFHVREYTCTHIRIKPKVPHPIGALQLMLSAVRASAAHSGAPPCACAGDPGADRAAAESSSASVRAHVQVRSMKKIFFYIQTFSRTHESIVHGYINNSSVLVLSLGLILGPGPQNRQGPWCWW